MLFSAELPQTWNRYAYVRNYPILYVDPSGELTAAGIADWIQIQRALRFRTTPSSLHWPPSGPGSIVGYVWKNSR
jgi:hypothetical protein